MRQKVLVLALFVLLCASDAAAQIAPAVGIRKNTPDVHALKNLTIVAAPGKKIENCTIVLRNGVIESAGANAAIPADARVWDCAGLTAYAGLIDLYTDIGQPKPRQSGPPVFAAPTPLAEPPRGTAHWNS